MENAEQTHITADVVRKKYPQVYEEIFKAGAQAERKRIEAIEDLGNFTGYEEVVKKMKFDGESTAEMVELAVFRAEREKKQKVAAQFSEDGSKAAALLAEAGTVTAGDGGAAPQEPSPCAKVLEKFERSK